MENGPPRLDSLADKVAKGEVKVERLSTPKEHPWDALSRRRKEEREEAYKNRPQSGPIPIDCSNCNEATLYQEVTEDTSRSSTGRRPIGGKPRLPKIPTFSKDYFCKNCGFDPKNEVIEEKLESLKSNGEENG